MKTHLTHYLGRLSLLVKITTGILCGISITVSLVLYALRCKLISEGEVVPTEVKTESFSVRGGTVYISPTQKRKAKTMKTVFYWTGFTAIVLGFLITPRRQREGGGGSAP